MIDWRDISTVPDDVHSILGETTAPKLSERVTP